MKKSRLLLILLACFAMSGLSMAQSSVPAQVDPDFASRFLQAKPEFQESFTFDAAKGTALCNDVQALNALMAFKATATKSAKATSPTPYLTPDPSRVPTTSQESKAALRISSKANESRLEELEKLLAQDPDNAAYLREYNNLIRESQPNR